MDICSLGLLRTVLRIRSPQIRDTTWYVMIAQHRIFLRSSRCFAEDFKKLENGCPKCHVTSSSMSFFCYYSAFSREPLPVGFETCELGEWSWPKISQKIGLAALKLPRENDALYRGMKPPLEGVSFRTVKKDTWRSDAENPQAYDDPWLPPPYQPTHEVEKKINPSRHFQLNRDLFLEGGCCGLNDVQPGDLLLPDQRISSFSSDPGTAMRYSSITGQRYPSTVIIIKDGFGLANQFTIGTCPLHTIVFRA